MGMVSADGYYLSVLPASVPLRFLLKPDCTVA